MDYKLFLLFLLKIQNYFEDIKNLINDSGIPFSGSGPATEEMITCYEKKLGVNFPESYKLFLKEYGTLSFNGESFYGISKKGLLAESVPDIVFATLAERKLGCIDNQMIYIKSSGYGPLFSIDTSIIGNNNEPVVVETQLSFTDDQEKIVIADNFVEFLYNEIKSTL